MNLCDPEDHDFQWEANEEDAAIYRCSICGKIQERAA
jgi:hypothetical protein